MTLYERRAFTVPASGKRQGECLHWDVLEAIANGAEYPDSLAALALSTREIDFARWCA